MVFAVHLTIVCIHPEVQLRIVVIVFLAFQNRYKLGIRELFANVTKIDDKIEHMLKLNSIIFVR